MILLIILCLLFWLVPTHAQAVPSVTGYSGTMSNGESITISGSAFGSNGPTVILFDDFELGTNGGNLSDQVRNAQVGTWRDVSSTINPYYPTYSNLNKKSGSLALRQNWGSGGDNQEGQRWAAPTFSSSFSKIYFSFWTYLPVGQNVPSGGIGANWKVWWLTTDDYFQNDYASEIITDPPTETSICYVDGSASRACWGYDSFTFTKGRWLRWEAYLIGSTTSSGAVYLWHTDSGNARHLTGSATGDNTLDNGTTGWGYLHFPGFGRYDTNSNTYYDDIYVAVGDGALARVEIGDNATYTSCTNLAVITPTSWSDTSITATVRGGSFTTGTAYLFVIDSSGAASSGYEVTIGGSGTPSVPTATGCTISGASMQ
jgi:hypothetical protein